MKIHNVNFIALSTNQIEAYFSKWWLDIMSWTLFPMPVWDDLRNNTAKLCFIFYITHAVRCIMILTSCTSKGKVVLVFASTSAFRMI